MQSFAQNLVYGIDWRFIRVGCRWALFGVWCDQAAECVPREVDHVGRLFKLLGVS